MVRPFGAAMLNIIMHENFIPIEDFTFAPTTVEFNLTNTRQCVKAVILDDNRREINELFMLNLTLVSLNNDTMLTSASVTIIDNECKDKHNVFMSYLQ